MGNFIDFLSVGINRYSLCRGLHGKIDMQTTDPEKWLPAIGASICEDYDKPTQRALKKIDKIAKNVRVETGDRMLSSLFLNVAVKRDHVTTRVVDGREMDDFKERDPYDCDYGISPDAMQKTLQEAWNDQDKSKPRRKGICAVITRAAGQQVACPACGGSGREQYVDGYFANGSERIKTGQCSQCMGSGKWHFNSNHCQVIKEFEEVKTITGCFRTASSYREFSYGTVNFARSRVPGHYDIDYSVTTMRGNSFDGQKACNFDIPELKRGIVKLYKNSNELLLDKPLPTGTSGKYKQLYQENRGNALAYFDSLREEFDGKLACTIEMHLEVPVYRICYSVGRHDYEFEICEKDGEIMYRYDALPELQWYQSLFL